MHVGVARDIGYVHVNDAAASAYIYMRSAYAM